MLVQIPSLPSPRQQNATVLFVRCEIANQKPYNPLRNPPPHKMPRETASHAAQYYTAPI